MTRLLARLRLRALLLNTPTPALLALAYVAFILIGAALMMLPIAVTAPITASDAIFTATSAVTVTGLTVIDTETGFTLFGQMVIAGLIQLGGLGLMTFAVLILSALGVGLGLTERSVLREDLRQGSYRDLGGQAQTMLRVVIAAEVAGALLLALVFVPDHGLGAGLWHAVFHAISAFNNAGFSTFSTQLVGYATDPVINTVIPAMFIVGGLGSIVVSEVLRRRRWALLSLHAKLMLTGTAALIVIGVGLTAILEWNNPRTLGQFDSGMARMTVAWFQGVTTRTAGFNSIDIAGLHDSTSLLYMALMVIGGGPASTAGGIKVTTVLVLLIGSYAFFRRRAAVTVFGRSIGTAAVLKVMALIALAGVLLFLATFLILVGHDGEYVDIAFEVASAFGTTGLSRGYTAELDGFGRAVIIALMFLGRIGPLTLGVFLATRIPPRVRWPEAQVHLG